MIRYLLLDEVLRLHEMLIATSGGTEGIRDAGALMSAISQPQATFDGSDLYPSLSEKAAALAFALIRNHPFIDGNKRIGHAAMEVFLILNGYELHATVDEQEQLFLELATGTVGRTSLTQWIDQHVNKRTGS